MQRWHSIMTSPTSALCLQQQGVWVGRKGYGGKGEMEVRAEREGQGGGEEAEAGQLLANCASLKHKDTTYLNFRSATAGWGAGREGRVARGKRRDTGARARGRGRRKAVSCWPNVHRSDTKTSSTSASCLAKGSKLQAKCTLFMNSDQSFPPTTWLS